MVSTKQLMNFILEEFPGFEKSWNAHLEWWKGGEAGLCNDMTVFSDYVIDLLKTNSSHDEIKKIFDIIEKLMLTGDDEVKNVVATCFLENLINATSSDRIPASSFVYLLGKKSKMYCKAWDEFTGIKTEGLWND